MRKLKKGDKVQVIAWKFKWAIFEIEKIKDDRVVGYIEVKKKIKDEDGNETEIVINNLVKKAVKGIGFVEKKLPIHISNVMYYCENCKKPVRVWIRIKENKKKVRYCKKCGKEFI